MNKDVVEVLMEEYKSLNTTYEKASTNGYTIVPGIAVFGSAIALVFSKSLDSWPLVFPWILSFIILLLGYSHSLINYYGIKLIELECKINKELKIKQKDGICFYSSQVANGHNIIPGANIYNYILVFLSFILLITCACYAWKLFPNDDCFSLLQKIGASFGPTVLVSAVLLTIYRTEMETRRQKKVIFNNYKTEISWTESPL